RIEKISANELPHLMLSNCGLEEKTANLGNCNNSKLEFGSFWELFGEAAKSVKLENTVQGS
uniref:Uncharacterized protein n=1 Tax=Bos mutus grunniens TaxID=30521 RepID=A0A8B9X389_BOSMU